MQNYYRIIGVPEDAGEQEIAAAYKRLAKQLHPDVVPDDVAAAERMRQVNKAYETLGSPDRRAAHDEGLRRERQRFRRLVAVGVAIGLAGSVALTGLAAHLLQWPLQESRLAGVRTSNSQPASEPQPAAEPEPASEAKAVPRAEAEAPQHRIDAGSNELSNVQAKTPPAPGLSPQARATPRPPLSKPQFPASSPLEDQSADQSADPALAPPAERFAEPTAAQIAGAAASTPAPANAAIPSPVTAPVTAPAPIPASAPKPVDKVSRPIPNKENAANGPGSSPAAREDKPASQPPLAVARVPSVAEPPALVPLVDKVAEISATPALRQAASPAPQIAGKPEAGRDAASMPPLPAPGFREEPSNTGGRADLAEPAKAGGDDAINEGTERLSVASGLTRQQALALVENVYLVADKRDPATLRGLYCRRVDYWGEARTSRHSVIAQIERFVSRWPQRKYKLRAETFRMDTGAKPGAFRLEFAYDFEIAPNPALAAYALVGIATGWLELIREDGRWRVCGEDGKFLKRQFAMYTARPQAHSAQRAGATTSPVKARGEPYPSFASD